MRGNKLKQDRPPYRPLTSDEVDRLLTAGGIAPSGDSQLRELEECLAP